MSAQIKESVFMQCGCAANAICHSEHYGQKAMHQCCLIHGPSEKACSPSTTPNLIGRVARCAYKCGSVKPSSVDLGFFEYLGPDSPASKECCGQCGYFEIAHKPQEGRARNQGVCLSFRPHGSYEFDKYYCGCRGWD